MDVLARIDELKDEGKLTCQAIMGVDIWGPADYIDDYDTLAVMTYFQLCAKNLAQVVYGHLKHGLNTVDLWETAEFKVIVYSGYLESLNCIWVYIYMDFLNRQITVNEIGMYFDLKLERGQQVIDWLEHLTNFTTTVRGSVLLVTRRFHEIKAAQYIEELCKSIKWDAVPAVVALRKRNPELAEDRLYHVIDAFLCGYAE